MTAEFYKSLRECQDHLVVAAIRWSRYLQKRSRSLQNKGEYVMATLPSNPAAAVDLELTPSRARNATKAAPGGDWFWPTSSGYLPDKSEAKADYVRHLRLLVAELFAVSPKLIRALSEVAWRTASASMLLSERDSFDISCHGVLTAVAFSNFTRVYPNLATATVAQHRLVLQPLETSQRLLKVAPPAPGDLWLNFVLARTAVLMARQAAAKSPSLAKPESTLCVAVTALVAQSTLCQLVDHALLLPPIRQSSNLTSHEIALLTGAAGAGSARRFVAGQLAARVVHAAPDQAAQAHSNEGVLAWLRALATVEDSLPLQRLLFVAHFLWEVLDQLPHVDNQRTADEQKSAEPARCPWNALFHGSSELANRMRSVVVAIERQAATEAPARHAAWHDRLGNLVDCLHCYPEYRRLLEALRLDTGTPSSPDSTRQPATP